MNDEHFPVIPKIDESLMPRDAYRGKESELKKVVDCETGFFQKYKWTIAVVVLIIIVIIVLFYLYVKIWPAKKDESDRESDKTNLDEIRRIRFHRERMRQRATQMRQAQARAQDKAHVRPETKSKHASVEDITEADNNEADNNEADNNEADNNEANVPSEDVPAPDAESIDDERIRESMAEPDDEDELDSLLQ